MPFNSLAFLCFLPLLWLVFRLCRPVWRWVVLLLFSLILIGYFRPWALGVVVCSSGITFAAALMIQRKFYPKLVLICSLVLQGMALVLLRYVESDSRGVRFMLHESGFRTDTIFYTLGFSFYTLQHIGYLLDVYYGRIQPEPNPFRFLLFSSFFAKFNAGPLEQPSKLLPQFLLPRPVQEDISYGLQRIVLGLFRKMVIADHLAPIVERIFDPGSAPGCMAAIAGVILFTLQLYFDFSAYCDLAIGIARLFGIRLSENFLFPLFSDSVSVFWRRWHITLINWFTTYLYYPTVFRLRALGQVAVISGIVLTFLVSGLWHGMGKTFLIWSLLHIGYLSYESLTKHTRLSWSAKLPPGIYRFFSILLTFILVCFSNLFFRSSDLSQAQHLLHACAQSPFANQGLVKGFLAPLAGGGYQEALFNLGMTLVLTCIFLFAENKVYKRINTGGFYALQLFILLFLVLVAGVFQKTDSFIYLQF